MNNNVKSKLDKTKYKNAIFSKIFFDRIKYFWEIYSPSDYEKSSSSSESEY